MTATGWIPIADGCEMPESETYVLVTLLWPAYNDFTVLEAEYAPRTKKWLRQSMPLDGRVTAWQPLPEPYNPNQEAA